MENGNAAIKFEESSLQQQLQSIDWDSERQLISSLSKLQELESKVCAIFLLNACASHNDCFTLMISATNDDTPFLDP
jgi:hypothetical protein